MYCNAFWHLCHTERIKNQIAPIKFQNLFQKAQGKTHTMPSDKKYSVTYCFCTIGTVDVES